jgi:hypothetical protein
MKIGAIVLIPVFGRFGFFTAGHRVWLTVLTTGFSDWFHRLNIIISSTILQQPRILSVSVSFVGSLVKREFKVLIRFRRQRGSPRLGTSFGLVTDF